MVIRGRVHEGVVIFDEQVSLPEGTEVTVEVCARSNAVGDAATNAQRQRLSELLRQLESLPNENPGDTFSGADHDRVLYGEG